MDYITAWHQCMATLYDAIKSSILTNFGETRESPQPHVCGIVVGLGSVVVMQYATPGHWKQIKMEIQTTATRNKVTAPIAKPSTKNLNSPSVIVTPGICGRSRP